MELTNISLAALNNLSEEERAAAIKILQEYAIEGKSDLLEELKYADFAEIPVDIETFIHEKQYLGNGLYDQEGRFTVYPFWEKKLTEIFPDNITTAYNNIVFTGAIGIGKSTIAVIILLYMLYRLLCLKNPYVYYGLQEIDKLTISLMNITLDNARGVAMDKMNQLILSSDWFMAHGEMAGTTNLIYRPEKHIEIVCASSNNQIIGRAVFCLAGDTLIKTESGYKHLEDLCNTTIKVISVDENGKEAVSNPCTVLPTVKTTEEYQIELEDGTIIECTPNHKLMLKDGTYKEAQYLTELDELTEVPATYNDAKRVAIKSVKKIILDKPKQFYDVIEAAPYHNFIIKTNSSQIVSHNCNFTDEANFSTYNNPEKQKQKMLKLITQVDARMRSRFLRGTYLPTVNIIASSKDTEQSFLEAYIENKRETESKTTLVVDEPQWVVDDRKDSPIKFYVGVGNKFLANELLPLTVTEAELDEYRAKGYQLWQVPIGYLEPFQQNLDEAICSIIGIATASSLKYISGVKLKQAKTDTYINPFTRDVITVGNAPEDKTQYYNFFDLARVNPEDLSRPLFIHLDMSLSGDKTGIAGTWITGKTINSMPTVLDAIGNTASAVDETTAAAHTDLQFKLAFSVSVQAPKGSQVSFAKNRNFIRWLRDQGFFICGVSSDTFQSAQIQQDLKNDGFKTSIISVDRVTKDANGKPICLPYSFLKNALYERRLILYDKCDLLTDELVGLERKSDGHVDHTKQGINCLTGDTLISLVDGREVPIKDLVAEYESGKENYVYTVNERTLKIEPKLIKKAYCSGTATRLLKITLDNDQEIRCTPEHRFMLRNGAYCMAKDLIVGESLMPLCKKCHNGAVAMRDYRTNHSVVSIEELVTNEEVFDLTICDNPNFALTAGIFVHNSKDQADAVCGSLWLASNFSEEYSYSFGDNLAATLDANEDETGDFLPGQLTKNFEDDLVATQRELLMADKIRQERQASKSLDDWTENEFEFYQDIHDGIIAFY